MLTTMVTRLPRASFWPARGFVRTTRPRRTFLLCLRTVRAMPQPLAMSFAFARAGVMPATFGTAHRFALPLPEAEQEPSEPSRVQPPLPETSPLVVPPVEVLVPLPEVVQSPAVQPPLPETDCEPMRWLSTLQDPVSVQLPPAPVDQPVA